MKCGYCGNVGAAMLVLWRKHRIWKHHECPMPTGARIIFDPRKSK